MALSMNLKVIFNVQQFSSSPSTAVQVFPNAGAPAPPGVGAAASGRYVVQANLKGVTGDYIFSGTNTHQNQRGALIQTGIITFSLKHIGFVIDATATYTSRATNPDQAFSEDKCVTPVTSASFNGRKIDLSIEMEPIDGGRSYRANFKLALVPWLLKALGKLGGKLLNSEEDDEPEDVASQQLVMRTVACASSDPTAVCYAIQG